LASMAGGGCVGLTVKSRRPLFPSFFQRYVTISGEASPGLWEWKTLARSRSYRSWLSLVLVMRRMFVE
jgi:hypothetical protein